MTGSSSSRPAYLPTVMFPINSTPSNVPTPAQSQPAVEEAPIPLGSLIFNMKEQKENKGIGLDPQLNSNRPVPKGAQATNVTSNTQMGSEQLPVLIAVEKLLKTNRLVQKAERQAADILARRQQHQGTSSDERPQLSADMPKRALPDEDEAEHPASKHPSKRFRQYSPLPKRKSDISMQDADEDDVDISMMSNASKPVRTTPPIDFQNQPPIEYEDITEEVDARMKAASVRKERQRMKDLGLLGSEKRKRQSGASVEDGGVNIRGGDGNTPSKRRIKKAKKSHRKSAGAAEELNDTSEQQAATSKTGDGTPKQAAPKTENSAELKRSIEHIDESAESNTREKRKKKKLKQAANLEHHG
jgi:hypothetical protein